MMVSNRRNVKTGEALSIAGLILALLLRCTGAQTSDNFNSTIAEYNKLTNIAYTTIVIVFIILILFVLLSSAILYNRRSATNSAGVVTRSSRRSQIGLGKTILSTFPTFAYSEVKSHKIGKGALECAVCLNEFADDEILRLIPKCDHVFHSECIDSWLLSHSTCPVCRANLHDSPPETFGTDSDSGPPAVESRTDDATTIDIPEPPARSDSVTTEPIDCTTKSPNRLKTVFFYSKLSKSHSTGHFLARSGDKIDRFTLILPIEIRNQIINRTLNRSSSDVVLAMESSLRKGYRIRTGGEEGSGRAGCIGPIGFGLFGRQNWNYNTEEGTSRFMSLVGPNAFQKLGVEKKLNRPAVRYFG